MIRQDSQTPGTEPPQTAMLDRHVKEGRSPGFLWRLGVYVRAAGVGGL